MIIIYETYSAESIERQITELASRKFGWIMGHRDDHNKMNSLMAR